MKSESTNLAQKTPLPASQIGDTSLNGAGDSSSYKPVVGDMPNYNVTAGLPNDMITSRTLNANSTAGVISKPSFGGGEPDNMISMPSVAIGNGEVNTLDTDYDHSDKSTHFSPQDAGAGGNQWQTPA